MKLRNKKTGEIVKVADNLGEGQGIVVFADIDYHYASLSELNEEWEDYEPLIKDAKIRKAVRSWAEINNVPTDVKLDVFEYLGTGVTVIRYLYNAKTLPHKRCVKFEYISSDEIYTSQNDREYTITELCG